MRKSPLLAPLFGPLMQGVLAATVLRPEREWYLSDLAAHLGVLPSSLQRPLAKLTDAGILRRRADGNRVYYCVDPECSILPELSGMLTKTIGIAEPLKLALAPLAQRIAIAFIHGSVAEGRERSESDIDLIIVGDLPSADLALAFRKPQEQLGHPVNFTHYSPAEFTAKRDSGHHFLSSVLQKPRIFLIGGEDDLEQIGRVPIELTGASGERNRMPPKTKQQKPKHSTTKTTYRRRGVSGKARPRRYLSPKMLKMLIAESPAHPAAAHAPVERPFQPQDN